MKKKIDNIIHVRPVVPLEEGDNPRSIGKAKKNVKLWILLILLIGSVVMSVYGYTQWQTFTNIAVEQTYDEVIVANSRFEFFLSGILKYGKDGASYIDTQGEMVWNYAYQITNPIIATTDQTAVIADVTGNQIVVVDKNGVKGEIETVLPIEKVAVSEQGIVAVLLKNGLTPQIICYDAVGNVLIEHKVSFTGTGYPIGMAISPDGTKLLVTYMQVTEVGMTTNYAYYNFANDDLVSSSVITTGSREGVIIPEVKFLNSETSVLISDETLEIFVGSTEPELTYYISLGKEIESVFYGDEEVGFVLDNSDGSYELRIYNCEGEMIFSEEFSGNYSDVDIVKNQIILYDDYECLIYSMQGVLKFEGQMEMKLSGVFPVFGINKYVIIGDEGMKEIQLVR